MKTQVKKLFKGNISLRDYIVQEAEKNNEGIYVEFAGEVMYLSPEKLKEGKYTPYELRSQYDNKKYRLVDYKWNPTQQLGMF